MADSNSLCNNYGLRASKEETLPISNTCIVISFLSSNLSKQNKWPSWCDSRQHSAHKNQESRVKDQESRQHSMLDTHWSDAHCNTQQSLRHSTIDTLDSVDTHCNTQLEHQHLTLVTILETSMQQHTRQSTLIATLSLQHSSLRHSSLRHFWLRHSSLHHSPCDTYFSQYDSPKCNIPWCNTLQCITLSRNTPCPWCGASNATLDLTLASVLWHSTWHSTRPSIHVARNIVCTCVNIVRTWANIVCMCSAYEHTLFVTYI